MFLRCKLSMKREWNNTSWPHFKIQLFYWNQPSTFEYLGRTCLSFTSSVPSVSQLGFEAIHIFITLVKADRNTARTVAFSTQSGPRGVTLNISSFPANVQLLRSASPGVLHDCSFKRSNLILYITQGAKGHSS